MATASRRILSCACSSNDLVLGRRSRPISNGVCSEQKGLLAGAANDPLAAVPSSRDVLQWVVARSGGRQEEAASPRAWTPGSCIEDLCQQACNGGALFPDWLAAARDHESYLNDFSIP